MDPKRSIYSNRTVKHSIKAVTTYILPRAPQPLLAALVELMLYGLSKRLNGRQLEVTRLNERQFKVTLGFYHII